MRPARARGRPGSRKAAGFTMAELLMTSLVIGTAFVGASWSMSALTRTHAAYAQDTGPAMYLAQEIETLAESLPRTPTLHIGVSSGAAVDALGSLSGANFSPPILADLSVAPGLDGWRQSVHLAVCALADPSTPTNLDPAAALAPEGAQVYRLDVSILHDGQLVDTFSWWINP